MGHGWPGEFTILLIALVAGAMVVACLRSLAAVLHTPERIERIRDEVEILSSAHHMEATAGDAKRKELHRAVRPITSGGSGQPAGAEEKLAPLDANS